MNTFFTEVRQTLFPRGEVKHGPLPPLLVAMTLVTGLVDAFSFSLVSKSSRKTAHCCLEKNCVRAIERRTTVNSLPESGNRHYMSQSTAVALVRVSIPPACCCLPYTKHEMLS
jgi:hypothetical protein